MLAKFKSKPSQPGLGIRFDGERPEDAVKNIPNVVSTATTKASVFGAVSSDVEKAKLKVVLRGIVRTKAVQQSSGAQNNGLAMHTETLVNETLLNKSIKNREGRRTEFDIPFSFCMADFEDGSALPEDAVGRTLTSPVLPPSTTTQSSDSRWKLPTSSSNSDKSFHVTYSISAILSVEKRRIGCAAREFNFIPISQPQPPVSSCDFPKEYVLSNSRETRSMNPLGKCHCTNIEVQSEEPEPLTIRTVDSKGSTKVNLMFKLEGRQADVLPKDCKIKTTLVTKTIVTPHWHGRWVPTLDDARASPGADIQIETSNEQMYAMEIQQWEALDREPSNDSQEFLATLPVRVFAFPGQLPCSTFFTPLVSRRYALDVTVSFPEIRRSELKLSLPLQVVYSDDPGAVGALRLVSLPAQEVRPLQSRHLAGVMLAA